MAIARFEAKGDHFAIGQALGHRAARVIREVIPHLARFQALRAAWAGSDYLADLEAAGRSAFPQFMQEIEGMAAGADASYSDLLLWNCRGDFPGGGDQGDRGSLGCTSLMLAAHNGSPAIIAHNEDDEAQLDGECFLIALRPTDGPSLTSFYSPGLLPGHTFGWNDKGLVQTINHIRPYDQRPGVPRHIVCRAILGSASLDMALSLLERSDRASGFHHNLGQVGDDRLLSVEAPASGCDVRLVRNMNVHTNHLLADRFNALKQEVAPSSQQRQARARQLIADHALVDRDPLAVLGDNDGCGLPICRKLIDGKDPGYTLATAVFELYDSALQWRVYTDPRERPAHQGGQAISAGSRE